jgi:hypothetical protein
MLAQIDIEELVQRCRSSNARIYIKEAADCYRIGAYRACVITTWIALVYDFVDKLRELALTGDKAAGLRVAEFDKIQKDEDLEGALRFEREVLGIVKDQFELITAQEARDLQRLLQDRNRCGHPNLNRDTDIYSPPPELARLHLRTAIEHVLERPPVQGKVALAALWASVHSDYFPITVADAKTILTATPLGRAKKNLIREFVAGALTSLMREDLTEKKRLQRLAACLAAEQLHPAEVRALLEDRFDGFVFASSDADLPRVIRLLARWPDYQSFIKDPCVTRLRTFVSNLPMAEITLLPLALRLATVQECAAVRLQTCTESEYLGMVAKLDGPPPKEFIDKCINFYVGAGNFNQANILAVALILPLVGYMTKAQAEATVACVKDSQVRGSNKFPSVISAIIQVGLITRAEALAVLVASGAAEMSELLLPAGA